MSYELSSFIFNSTASLRFGIGAIRNSAVEIKAILGHRIFVVTDPGITGLELYKTLLNELCNLGSQLQVFDTVEPDPSLKTCINSVSLGKSFSPTGVLGFGGGSSMDVAKISALLIGSNDSIDNIWGVDKAFGPRLPLGLIPTTAGTGSEVTPVAIITISDGEKRGVVSPLIIPDLAILDPEITLGLPSDITAATGIDAMVHAIEAYSSRNDNNNYLSKILACEALNLLGRSIRKATAFGNDIKNREDMLLGSLFAGMAFANSPVAAVHALAYPLGGMFNISHGLSNSLVLTHVLRFNCENEKAARDYARLALLVFPEIEKGLSDLEYAKMFCNKLDLLIKSLGLPTRLRDLLIPQTACKEMAQAAIKQTRLLINNPREVTEKDALKIYLDAW